MYCAGCRPGGSIPHDRQGHGPSPDSPVESAPTQQMPPPGRSRPEGKAVEKRADIWAFGVRPASRCGPVVATPSMIGVRRAARQPNAWAVEVPSKEIFKLRVPLPRKGNSHEVRY